MCFCLLPVTGSDLNFLLLREVYLCNFGHFNSLWTFCAFKSINFGNG